MALQVHSQTISPRVQTLVNSKGDTLIQMTLADAKIVLADVLGKQYSDSLVSVYTDRDSLQNNIIILQKEELLLMSEKFNNQKTIADNLNQVLANKDTEIALLNDTIKKQKKEIRKQKFLKVLGFTAAVVLPITTIILMSH
jgi:hypothetical protein